MLVESKPLLTMMLYFHSPIRMPLLPLLLLSIILLLYDNAGVIDAFSVETTTSATKSSLLLCRLSARRGGNDDNGNEKKGYQFGDLTRGILGRVQADVNSLTGKDEYEFGDLTRWMDQQVRASVLSFTNRPNYQFGDISKELMRRLRQGEYSEEDIWLFVKFMALGINLTPIAQLLPIKVLIEMIDVSIAQDVSKRIVSELTKEVDRRMKLWVTGDKDYQLGDITRKKLTGDKNYQFGDLTKRLITKYTGKDSYKFGDITKTIMERRQQQLASEGISKGNSNDKVSDGRSRFLELDEQTQTHLEALDKEFLASTRNATDDDFVKQEAFSEWDQKFLATKDKDPC